MSHYNKYGRLCDGSKPLSDDLRQLIVTDIQEQGGDPETGQIPRGVLSKLGGKYRVPPYTISRVWKRYVEFNSVASVKTGRKLGEQRKLSTEDEIFIEQMLTAQPTLYQKEIQAEVLQYTNNVDLCSISQPTISRTIRKRLSGGEWSRKKVNSSNKYRWTRDNMRLTQEYLDFISQQDRYNIKFMDEAGVNIASGKRNYGYSVKGEVAFEISKHLKVQNHTVNLLIGLDGTKFCTVIDGPSNNTQYMHFWHQAMNATSDLGQSVLNPGDIIVVDNCKFHHSDSEDILIDYFADFNIQYIFLPRYSPDFNPVEACFLKMKTLLKQAYYQTLLENNFVSFAVLQSIRELTLSDIHGFYKGTTRNYMNIP